MSKCCEKHASTILGSQLKGEKKRMNLLFINIGSNFKESGNCWTLASLKKSVNAMGVD